MGLFLNRRDKHEQQQKLAEMQRRRSQLAAQFEREIPSLAAVFEEAMKRGCGRGVDRSIRNVQTMLLMDFINIVCTICAEIGNPDLSAFKKGGGTLLVALTILKTVAPEELPKPGDLLPKLASMHFDDELAQLGAELSEFTMACKALQSGCTFCIPGLLLVMQEYDRACGTLYSCTVADMFLAFMLELEQPPVALKGTRIMEAYISALTEYASKKSSALGHEVPASV